MDWHKLTGLLRAVRDDVGNTPVYWNKSHMKNHYATMIAAILAVALLASCRGKVAEPEPVATDTGAPGAAVASPIIKPSPTVTPDVPVAVEPLHPLGNELSELWSRIDGSTATIPLTAALYEAIQGGTSQPPLHNTTPDAYRRLILNEGADLIFVTYPSEDEFRMAKENGVELEIVPVTKDALVFLVNAENPVDNISMPQLQEVYTGAISDWNELGGLPGLIVPYQRPNGSGSQTLFLKLVMGGLFPMDPPNEWVYQEMAGLVESISNYDNSRSAIGYSMFYYVNNMYGNSRFKLLSVDGIKPTRESIALGEYPLDDCYYAVMRKDAPEGSPARRLVDWLLGDEGQALAIRAGYIPLRPIEGILSDDPIDPIYLGETDNSSGTGGTALKKGVEGVQPVNGVRPPLSDLFFDGFNYIRYINDQILEELTWFDYDEWQMFTWWEQYQKRPFTGIPNNYPNYEIKYRGDLIISLPFENPFFAGGRDFRINLTEDISPYGQGAAMLYSETYHYDRRILPRVQLFTMRVSISGKPEVSERINEQLAQWSDSFPNSEVSMEVFNNFNKWCSEDKISDEDDDFDYMLRPSAGLWNGYMSVSFKLYAFCDLLEYMVCTKCFDAATGDTVDLVSLLPDDLDYSQAQLYPAIDFSLLGTSEPLEQEWPSLEYVPAAGSVITNAWIEYNQLIINLTEPDGRKLRAEFM